jgi:hypothetical protein
MNGNGNGVRLEWTYRDDLLLDPGEPIPQVQQVYDRLDRIYDAIEHFRQRFGRAPSIYEQMVIIDALAPS